MVLQSEYIQLPPSTLGRQDLVCSYIIFWTKDLYGSAVFMLIGSMNFPSDQTD